MYASSWKNRNSGPLQVGKLVARGRETLAHLARLGVRIPTPNRLDAAIHVLEDFNEGRLLVKEDDPNTQRRVLEALRDVWEAFLILYTRLDRRKFASVFPVDELQYLVLGADSASEEGDPKPRSSQFEMTVAARLILGGADVRREEPDLRFLYFGEYVGVAAKRIRRNRVRTVEEALRDATHQLTRQGVRGFIAFSVDPWLDGLRMRDGVEAYWREFNLQLADIHQLIARTDDTPYVMGVFLFGHASGWRFENGEPRLEWSEGLQIARFSNDPVEIERSSEFLEPFRERMWNGLAEVHRLIMPSRYGGR